MKELFIPHAAETDQKAIEIARIWIAHRQQHVSLLTGPWSEAPASWGIMLCDLAHHVANAYEEQGLGNADEIFSSIVERFNDEAFGPTDEVVGQVITEQ